MGHQIDMSTGRPAIAYAGAVPWHALGSPIDPGDSIETIRRKAGLGWDVEVGRAYFSADGHDAPIRPAPGLRPLIRSDSGALLSMVSDKYRPVQPSQIVAFFARLCEIGGFEVDTAGALTEGRRVWMLARVNDGAPVVGQDRVRPYVLFATSYDGLMATIAKFTAIRVVCHNTISMAVPEGADGAADKVEQDRTVGAVVQAVRVPHTSSFDPEAVRLQLGIVANAWERWLVQARVLAEVGMSEAHADAFLQTLFAPSLNSGSFVSGKARTLEDAVRSMRGYRRVMDLFDGSQIGAELAGRANRWAMLNAVTQWVDHERGRTPDSRLSSAWFGESDRLKSRALALLTPPGVGDDRALTQAA